MSTLFFKSSTNSNFNRHINNNCKIAKYNKKKKIYLHTITRKIDRLENKYINDNRSQKVNKKKY